MLYIHDGLSSKLDMYVFQVWRHPEQWYLKLINGIVLDLAHR